MLPEAVLPDAVLLEAVELATEPETVEPEEALLPLGVPGALAGPVVFLPAG